MQLSGLPVDAKLRSDFLSKIPSSSNVNNFDTGNSTATRNLNTAGYRFNQTDLNNRDQYGFRVDYSLTDKHRFEGIYSYFKETDDRTDLDFISPDRPLVFTNSTAKRFSLAWRWLASANFQNEARGGANLAPVQFNSNWQFPAVLYNTALSIINPVGGNGTPTTGSGTSTAFQPQGRYTNTYQVGDSASLMLGNHSLQLGGSWQRNHVNPYNFAAVTPIASFGFSTAAPTSVQLTSAQFPGGISSAELTNANALASWVGGIVSSVSQTFQVQDTSSGFVAGIPANENYTLDNIATYLQDNWRWKPNFTIRGGVKWEYYSPLREDNNLGFLPVLNSRGFDQVMLDPATTVTFVNGDFYKKDLNNFGPTAGFSWDLTKDGKTAVRGGYSLTFVNEETVTVGRAASRGNAGLSSAVTLSNQYTAVSAGVPAISTPTFLTTRTLADQIAAERNRSALGHRSRHPVAESSPGQLRHPARAALVERRRSEVRRHLRTRYLAGHRLQPGEDQPGLPGRFQPRAVERLPRAAGGSGLQPGVQRGGPGQRPAHGAAEFRHGPPHQQHGDQQSPDESGGRARRFLHDQPRAWCARDVHAESRLSTRRRASRTAPSATTTRCSWSSVTSIGADSSGSSITPSRRRAPTRRARRRTASRHSWTTSGRS